MRVVDFHTHVVPPWVIQERESLAHSDACFGMLYSNPRGRLATVEDLIRSMDEAHVSISVALNIGWCSHDLCVRTNDYLIESAGKWPERIIPFCMVQPTSTDFALKELERCAAGGARGIGELRPDAQQYSLADIELLRPLVNVASSHRMMLLSHVSEPVGHEYPGKGTITVEQPYALARAFPEANLVFAHWGGGLPFYALMPEVKNTLANVYFDTAASRYLYRPEVFEIVSRLVGADHVLFGSDYPLLSQQRAVDEVIQSTLDRGEQTSLLSGNATRLLQRGGSLLG